MENRLYTKDSLAEFELNNITAVYFPHFYNFSGELYLIPSERVEALHLSPAEIMKFVVSAGVTKIESTVSEAKDE